MEPSLFITGGCGFIGSNFIRNWLACKKSPIVNLDALTYAGNVQSLFQYQSHPLYTFVHGNISNADLLNRIFQQYQPQAIINFAAESHVDRSIHGAEIFIKTNITGTFTLLESARTYWNLLKGQRQENFKFIHVSTDEVYGHLEANDDPFSENSPYQPNNPYSASKAASDHFVRAWYKTYGLPTIITNCSNNYGPTQFPEKLIPLMIINALQEKKLPIYGDGLQIRDWLYVHDHCQAIQLVLEQGQIGSTYCIGGESEKTNKDVVKTICLKLDHIVPRKNGKSYAEQITFVTDRPGHDPRYAINIHKIKFELGWKPSVTFDQGLELTIQWYLDNQNWIQSIQNSSYHKWCVQNYQKWGVA